MPPSSHVPFWKIKKLSDLTQEEWESLCDGCGQCCMHKLEDEDTGKIYRTSVACVLLSPTTCRCKSYVKRHKIVPDCIKLTEDIIAEARWLPESCAYRLLYEGKDLPAWHPLISSDSESVHKAGISVRGKIAIYEDALSCEEDFLNYMIETENQEK